MILLIHKYLHLLQIRQQSLTNAYAPTTYKALKKHVRPQFILSLHFTRFYQQTDTFMTDIQQLKRLSIRDYLSRWGIQPARENARSGFYLSPFRAEHTPSLKVDYAQNLWYDFGTGEGGSIIDLVMRLERCDLTQAVRLLDGSEKTAIVAPVPSSVLRTVPALRILSEAPLRHPALVGYLSSRGITPTVASIYCREVRYEINGRLFFAIGFRNDAGGWELRNRYFKGCTSPKQITTVDNHADTSIAFEGFMDFLSYVSLKPTERLCIDVVVLNSVVNLPKAIPFLERHPTIHAFFDNDEAGRRAIAELERSCSNSTIVEQAYHYRPHNDLNDYLRSRRPVKEHKQSRGRKL